eukprot:scaffold2536_cov169-Amphora_coffeaeformis.AAC.7
MGVRHQKDSSTFGVIVPVPRIDLPKFDEREKGYSRISLPLDHVSPVSFLEYTTQDEELFLEAQSNPQEGDSLVKIWTYLPDVFCPADERYPIVQSYVDTILRGCLDVGGEAFAQKFIETTRGWNPKDLSEYNYLDEHENEILRASSVKEEEGSFWIDDRDDPIYTRGDPAHSRANAKLFDSLLQTYAHRNFPRRRKLLSQ